MKTTALLLGAGAGRRMGALKQLLPIGGQPMLQLSLDHLLASKVDEVVVVLGCEARKVRAALTRADDERVRVVENPVWQEGMSTSLIAGLRAAGDADAVLVALGDLPLVAPRVIDRILAEGLATDRTIVAPTYQGRRGHPVLFRSERFQDLRALTGDVGAASVLKAHPDQVHLVPVDTDGILRDVDLPRDLMDAAEAQG